MPKSTIAAPRLSTALAALLSLAALLGLAVQFWAQLDRMPDPVIALWALLRYFTVLTNVAVAVVFAGCVFSRPPPIVLYGTLLCAMLVGVVYVGMLRDLPLDSSGDGIANLLLHHVTPLLALAYLLLGAPRGFLSWRAPLAWTAVPLAYVLYAFARAAVDGNYPYPFLNLAKLGAGQVALNCLVIGGGFLVAGFGLVALDKGLARRGS
jgi:hypothetical protein